METYNLLDEVSEYDLSTGLYKWIVVHYESGCEEGQGEAIALGLDGFLYGFNLDHCSCYGSFENSGEKISIEEFVKGPDNHIDNDYVDVRTKVLELLKDEEILV